VRKLDKAIVCMTLIISILSFIEEHGFIGFIFLVTGLTLTLLLVFLHGKIEGY
jgi:hypothetical protein